MHSRRSAWLLGVLALASCATHRSNGSDELAVRSTDDLQRRLVLTKNVPGLEALAHPGLVINAPAGRVLTREQFLANMRSGEIAAEQFTRTPEAVRISGKTALMMGSETFTPVATSELGRTYGAVALKRRYTNVYVRDGRGWKWIGRHASVVPQSR